MKTEGVLKHFLGALLIAIGGYMLLYTAIEHRRTKNGPWEVSFNQGSDQQPFIVINQKRLGVHDVVIEFPGQSVVSRGELGTVSFGKARPVPYPLAFGKCVFLDTTFLPGTVTMDLYGHEVELLPRVLVIDGREHPWRSGEKISVGQARSSKEI